MFLLTLLTSCAQHACLCGLHDFCNSHVRVACMYDCRMRVRVACMYLCKMVAYGGRMRSITSAF
jgi:hypothetical protein